MFSVNRIASRVVIPVGINQFDRRPIVKPACWTTDTAVAEIIHSDDPRLLRDQHTGPQLNRLERPICVGTIVGSSPTGSVGWQCHS